jgi:glycosyltransferase involved in cell wall biosynthesis
MLVRNEEERLPLSIQSIINQTVTPRVCAIIDDGSTDNTPKIIDKLRGNFAWIYCKTLPKDTSDAWAFSWSPSLHIATVAKAAFEYAQEICSKNGISYEYIGNVDADFILPEDYFERLIERFQKDPQLGIASGKICHAILKNGVPNFDNAVTDRALDDCPNSGARLYRKACFDGIGGFPLVTCNPDGVALAKARLLGWRTRCFREISAFATRRTLAGGNLWRGYKLTGYEAYCLDYHPLLVLLSAGGIVLKRPYYPAFAWLYGYLLGFFHRKEKVKDPELRHYYHHQRLLEVKRILLSKLMRVFRRTANSEQ